MGTETKNPLSFRYRKTVIQGRGIVERAIEIHNAGACIGRDAPRLIGRSRIHNNHFVRWILPQACENWGQSSRRIVSSDHGSQHGSVSVEFERRSSWHFSKTRSLVIVPMHSISYGHPVTQWSLGRR